MIQGHMITRMRYEVVECFEKNKVEAKMKVPSLKTFVSFPTSWELRSGFRCWNHVLEQKLRMSLEVLEVSFRARWKKRLRILILLSTVHWHRTCLVVDSRAWDALVRHTEPTPCASVRDPLVSRSECHCDKFLMKCMEIGRSTSKNNSPYIGI